MSDDRRTYAVRYVTERGDTILVRIAGPHAGNATVSSTCGLLFVEEGRFAMGSGAVVVELRAVVRNESPVSGSITISFEPPCHCKIERRTTLLSVGGSDVLQ